MTKKAEKKLSFREERRENLRKLFIKPKSKGK